MSLQGPFTVTCRSVRHGYRSMDPRNRRTTPGHFRATGMEMGTHMGTQFRQFSRRLDRAVRRASHQAMWQVPAVQLLEPRIALSAAAGAFGAARIVTAN